MIQSAGSSGDSTDDPEPELDFLGFRWPAAIFLIALVLRAIASLRTAVIFNDGPNFIRIAELMNEGRWAEALGNPYHPLYPLLIAALHPVVPDAELAGMLLSVLGGSLAVLALYSFLVAAYDRRTATIGALLLALSPYAIRFSADVQSDSIYLALFLLAVAALYRALRDASFRLALVTGGLVGLAYLTRPEGLGVALVGVVLAVVAGLRRDWRPLKVAGWVTSLGLGLGIPAIPYVLIMQSQSGTWSLSQKKSVIELLGLDASSVARLAEDGLGAIEMKAPLMFLAFLLLICAVRLARRPLGGALRPSFRPLRIGPALFGGSAIAAVLLTLALAPTEAADFSAVLISTMRPEFLVLLVVGLASQPHRGPKGRAIFISAFVALYAIVLFGLLTQYGYLSRRHALPLVALLMGYGAIGLSLVEHWLRRLHTPARVESHRWRLAILFVVLASITLPKTYHDDRTRELPGRRAAEWLRTRDEAAEGRFASKRSKLGYYAQRPWQMLYEDGELLSADALHARGVRFVVAERGSLTEDLSAKRPLSREGVMGLVERHREHADGYDAVLFEILPVAPALGATPSP